MHSLLSVGENVIDRPLQGEATLGGAALNVAVAATRVGLNATLVSAVGADASGSLVRRQLRACRVKAILTTTDLPTDEANVTFDDLTGEPAYAISFPSAMDGIRSTRSALRVASSADAVVFGTLAQRTPESRAAIRALVAATPRTALRILDLNLRTPHDLAEVIVSSLPFANILKLNKAELDRLALELNLHGPTENRLRALRDRYSYRLVALTLGAEGSAIATPDGLDHQPGRHGNVIDPVGAGDSFVAALAAGLLKDWTVEAAHSLAADVAAFVVGRAGATPELPAEFARRLE